jgi:ABC-2 type transport system permease protein
MTSRQEARGVTSLAPAAPPSAWAEPGPLRRFLLDTWSIADIELRKVRHDPSELVTRAVQPVLWLLIFGQVLASTRVLPTGEVAYLDYLTPGVLAQSALFAAIFYGITIIWERDLGVVHKYLVSPASRTALVAGRAVTAGLRSISQAVIVIVLALLLGVHIVMDPVRLAGVALVVVLGSAVFSLFSLAIACVVRTRERLMGIGQLLTMPLFFASNAIYPISAMPGWLQVIAVLNPLTYMVSALRSLMLAPSVDPLELVIDVGILGACAAGLTLLTARLYPRVIG